MTRRSVSGVRPRRPTSSATSRSAGAVPWPIYAVLALLLTFVISATLRAYRMLALPLQAHASALTPAADSDGQMAAFTPEVRSWWPSIESWAAEFELQPHLVATVMQIESCGHPGATSSAGAIGLFQVMPFHFSEREDPYRPDTNAARGLAYLSAGLRLAQGNTSLALAGYNGGHSLIGKPQTTWPSETQRYVDWGSNLLHDVEAGRTPSPTLTAWLAAGGSSLCRQAAAHIAAIGSLSASTP